MMNIKKSLYLLPEEIIGALIVDSEGYIYGKVDNVRFENGKAYLIAVIEVDVGEIVVDEIELRKRLSAKNIDVSPLNLHELISLARKHGIAIPKARAEQKEKIKKGEIPIDEILWIDKGMGNYIVLLPTPREAKYRGLKESDRPILSNVENKLVLSISRGFLGTAVGLAIGPGELALRVSPSGSTINWLRFTTELRKRGYLKLEEKLSNVINPYKNPRISIDMLSEIEDIVGNNKEVNKLLKECIEWGDYIHVSSSSILKVGDVIIVE